MTPSETPKANRFRFRAWDKVKKEMMYMDKPEYRGQFSFYFCEANEHHGYGVGVSHFQGEIEKTDSWLPGDLVLMQSTGLTDKNGIEIFEGDILRDSSRPSRGFKAIVEWHDGQFCGATVPYRNHCLPLRSILRDEGTGYDEICGNIYENPSLLPSLLPS